MSKPLYEPVYPIAISVSDELAIHKASEKSPWCVYAFFDGEFGEPPIAEYPATLGEGLAVQAACRIQNALDRVRAEGVRQGADQERARIRYPFEVMLSPVTDFMASADMRDHRKTQKTEEVIGQLSALVKQQFYSAVS